MRLPELFPGAPDAEVTGLAYDSRQVQPGGLFFCVSGHEADGHAFASDAVRRGAAALVVERPMRLRVPEVVVPSVRAEMGPAAARFFGHPSRELSVVGITGTDGKTTTAYLLRGMLEAAGLRTGLVGTVTRVIGGRELESARTTPEAIDLQRDLRAMATAGDRAAVLEMSSHGLALRRADATHFAAAIFTKLTREHLDFHRTMDAYFQAKRRLFTGDTALAVVNVDDPYGARLARELPNVCTFAIDSRADYRAESIRIQADGAVAEVVAAGERVKVRVPLIGRFNLYNTLAAYAVARHLGVSHDLALAGLERMAQIPGRLERVSGADAISVFVDYAHTPDGLENVLTAAREVTDGRLICVFGCRGDRDRGKRPAMGRIARRLADDVILTSDNPNSEDPEEIVEQIIGGRRDSEIVITDRRQAIRHAIALADPGDTVLILGRGHEAEQRFARHAIAFDDRLVAREAVAARHGAYRASA